MAIRPTIFFTKGRYCWTSSSSTALPGWALWYRRQSSSLVGRVSLFLDARSSQVVETVIIAWSWLLWSGLSWSEIEFGSGRQRDVRGGLLGVPSPIPGPTSASACLRGRLRYL